MIDLNNNELKNVYGGSTVKKVTNAMTNSSTIIADGMTNSSAIIADAIVGFNGFDVLSYGLHGASDALSKSMVNSFNAVSNTGYKAVELIVDSALAVTSVVAFYLL